MTSKFGTRRCRKKAGELAPTPAENGTMQADPIDTQFLKGTVAAVLVRACAECAVQRPADPVDFVAGWLSKWVSNDAILTKHAVAKRAGREDAAEAVEVSYRTGETSHVSRHIAEPPQRSAFLPHAVWPFVEDESCGKLFDASCFLPGRSTNYGRPSYPQHVALVVVRAALLHATNLQDSVPRTLKPKP